MIRLPLSLSSRGTPAFEAVLKQEIERLEPGLLPLQQGLARSSHVTDRPFQARIIACEHRDGRLSARVGIFYSGVIGGCSCADDPTPVDEISEYCELRLYIDPVTAATTVTLLSEDE